MLKIIKLNRVANSLVRSTCFLINTRKEVSSFNFMEIKNLIFYRNVSTIFVQRNIHQTYNLSKYNKKSTLDEDSDDDDDAPEFKDERDSKVVKTKLNSLRTDLLLKAGLGMARNKIEEIFYASKIRVNGEKISKKSINLDVGDEIDVIRGVSENNPSHIVVSRVILLAVTPREEGYNVSLRRYKSLLVENYSGVNMYKSSEVKDNVA